MLNKPGYIAIYELQVLHVLHGSFKDKRKMRTVSSKPGFLNWPDSNLTLKLSKASDQASKSQLPDSIQARVQSQFGHILTSAGRHRIRIRITIIIGLIQYQFIWCTPVSGIKYLYQKFYAFASIKCWKIWFLLYLLRSIYSNKYVPWPNKFRDYLTHFWVNLVCFYSLSYD